MTARALRATALAAITIASSAFAAPAPRPATVRDLVPATPVADTVGDVAGGPLDLEQVALTQRGLDLELTITTNRPWKLQELSARAGRSLCIDVLAAPGAETERATVCAAGSETAPAMVFRPVNADGTAGTEQRITIGIERPDPETFVATIPPVALGLQETTFSWRVVSRWENETTCSADGPCVDSSPDADTIQTQTTLLSAPRCFGALSRPTTGSCENPKLRTMVVPVPEDAVLQGNSFCYPTGRIGVLNPCRFRAKPDRPTATVALIGDSHASHWRGGLTVVANARRWEGISLTRSGCRYSAAPPERKSAADARDCRRFRAGVRRWLADRPSVRTVFLSNHVGGFEDPARFAKTVAGARAAIEALPKSVTRVYVLRDVPRDGYRTADCVTRALRKGRPAGPACSLSRRWALPPAATVIGARRAQRRGVHVLDLSRRFCDAKRCYPVVGGALVHNDVEHLTDTFSTTLGPVLLGRLDAIERRGR